MTLVSNSRDLSIMETDDGTGIVVVPTDCEIHTLVVLRHVPGLACQLDPPEVTALDAPCPVDRCKRVLRPVSLPSDQVESRASQGWGTNLL